MSSSMGMTGVAQMCKPAYFTRDRLELILLYPAADYCASKAALIGMHESLRYELDKR